jgi:hypothetical protein
MAAARLLSVLLLALFALSLNKVSAADPDMLQDLCVADLKSRKQTLFKCLCFDLNLTFFGVLLFHFSLELR